ncbi:uncharacterized membrane protein YjjB (DUF3815 family) [Sporosarcina luteola]|nr:uncharacterized membrane protein YjjB (DUF3815 family) [Sporosarcina luteola]
MDDRFDLSFKNKEVRMAIYILAPFFIIGFTLLIIVENKYFPLVQLIPLVAWTIYYLWRFSYRRKKKKESAVM